MAEEPKGPDPVTPADPPRQPDPNVADWQKDPRLLRKLDKRIPGQWGMCKALAVWAPHGKKLKQPRPCRVRADGPDGLCRFHKLKAKADADPAHKEAARKCRQRNAPTAETRARGAATTQAKVKEKEDFRAWAKEHWKARGGRVPLEWEGREFLIEPLFPPTPPLVIMKAVQLGVSEAVLAYAIWRVKRGDTAIWGTPSDREAKEFVQLRVDPIFGFLPDLAPIEDSPDNLGLKGIGEGFLFIRGLASARRTQSIPADLNIYDEVDQTNPRNLSRMRSRLGASADPGEIWVGNPSLPGHGIARKFEASDQRHWWIVCPNPGCLHRWALCCAYPIGFAERGPAGVPALICPACGIPLSPKNRSAGKWIPAAPGEPGKPKARGYHMNWLIAPWKTALEIIQSRDEYDLIGDWYNDVLGMPFAGDSLPVSVDDVAACEDHRLVHHDAGEGWSLGADQGNTLHIVLGKRCAGEGWIQIGHFEKVSGVDRFERIDFLIRQFGVRCAVIDGQPSESEIRKFALKFPGRVWLQYYEDHKSKELAKWDAETSRVIVRRTDALGTMCDHVRAKALRVFPLESNVDGPGREFARHVSALRRTVEFNAHGIKIVRFGKVGPDHYAHALSNLVLACGSRHSFPFRIEVAEAPALRPTGTDGASAPVNAAALAREWERRQFREAGEAREAEDEDRRAAHTFEV